MNIDEIQYGNMSRECLFWVNKQTYLDKHFTDLTSFTFSENSSDTTRAELNKIVTQLGKVTMDENKEVLQRYLEFDRKSFKFFREIIEASELITDKQGFNNMLDAVISDTSPLIYKLKAYFQRPRPFQLAHAYKLKLFPFRSYSQDSPSFPSAFVYHSRIITVLLGNLCPQLYQNMQMLFSEICHSRIALGFSYESDVDIAIFTADKVLDDNEFKVKYKI